MNTDETIEDRLPLVAAVLALGEATEYLRRPGHLEFSMPAPVTHCRLVVRWSRFVGTYGSICEMQLQNEDVGVGRATYAPTVSVVEALKTPVPAVALEKLFLEWYKKRT